MKATFAFVGAFTMSPEEYLDNGRFFRDIQVEGVNWLDQFRRDAEEENYDGWLNPKALELVQTSENHEIASHGFSHLPLSELLISQESFQHEMLTMIELGCLK